MLTRAQAAHQASVDARGDAQAFSLLRQASQRSNVPVRDLAAQIAAKWLPS